MKKTLVVLALVLSSLPAFAVDSPTATRFLRDYTKALCAEKNGDHAMAADLMQPWMLDKPDLRRSAREALRGDYEQATIQASWALVTNNWASPEMRFSIGKHEREAAVSSLRECFGSAITEGPQPWQAHLDAGAALLGYFLVQEIDPVNHPRNMWKAERRVGQ